jgi:hypothetical protein
MMNPLKIYNLQTDGYDRVVQLSGGQFYDGNGELIGPVTTNLVEYAFNFSSVDTYNFILSTTLRFDSFTTSTTMSVDFQLNGSTYSFGTTVSLFDNLEITPDVTGLIVLYGVKL